MKNCFPLVSWEYNHILNTIEAKSLEIKNCAIVLSDGVRKIRFPIFDNYTAFDAANTFIKTDILFYLKNSINFDEFKSGMVEDALTKFKSGELVSDENLKITFYSAKKFINFYNSVEQQIPKEFKELL